MHDYDISLFSLFFVLFHVTGKLTLAHLAMHPGLSGVYEPNEDETGNIRSCPEYVDMISGVFCLYKSLGKLKFCFAACIDGSLLSMPVPPHNSEVLSLMEHFNYFLAAAVLSRYHKPMMAFLGVRVHLFFWPSLPEFHSRSSSSILEGTLRLLLNGLMFNISAILECNSFSTGLCSIISWRMVHTASRFGKKWVMVHLDIHRKDYSFSHSSTSSCSSTFP